MNTFISLLVFFSKAKRLLVESLTGHTEESKRNAGNDIVFFPVFSDRKGNEDWKETSAIEHYKQRTVYGISFSFGASPHSHRRGVALHRQPAVRCSVSFLSLSLSFDFKGRTHRPGRCDNTCDPLSGTQTSSTPLKRTHASAEEQQRLNRCLLRAMRRHPFLHESAAQLILFILFILFILIIYRHDYLSCWTNISLGCLKRNGIILLLRRPWLLGNNTLLRVSQAAVNSLSCLAEYARTLISASHLKGCSSP